MMQVKIGNGGSNPVGVRFGGGGAIRSAVQSMASPENWLLDAGILLLVVVVIALAVLIIREFYLRKKQKK
jgi:hypothetical protein